MTYAEFLTAVDLAANGGAILTGISTLVIAFVLANRHSGEKQALEDYLKQMTAKRKREGGDGLENLLEVMRQTKLSEEAIMRAAFSSENVKVRSRLDDDRRTKELVFGYGSHN